MELSRVTSIPPASSDGLNTTSGVGGGNITADEFLAMVLGNLSATLSTNTATPTSGLSLINDTFIGGGFGFGSYLNSSNFQFNGTLYFGNLTGNGTLLGGTNSPSFAQGTYPSGYKLPQIVFASVVVTILMVIIVVGNMLVIIAIATEKSLKNIQNWFIASLAVSDFFLGLVIMPFSLANELMGYWVFGSWWCDIHSAMDVLLSTASIMNLCLISLDRFWSITKAIEYLRQRTPSRAAIMIMTVWIMSGLICIPPLLGWKVKQPDGPLPQCQVS